MARFIGIGTPYLCIDKYLCPTRLRLVQISVFPIFLFFRFCGETIWACPIFLFFRFLGETIEAWNSIFPLESFHVSIAYRLFAPIEKSRCFLKLSHATETLLSNTKYSTSHRLCASGTSSRYLNIPPFICETLLKWKSSDGQPPPQCPCSWENLKLIRNDSRQCITLQPWWN